MCFALGVPSAQAAVKIDEFGTPTANSGPGGIAMGSDGNLWFTEESANNIGQLTPSKVPVFNFEFPVTAGIPGDIVSGSDGNLWFTENYLGPYAFIGRITPSGTVTEFQDPLGGGAEIFDIAPGPDDNLWYTVISVFNGAGFLGRITTSGTITHFSVPAVMEGITAGRDGNLWATANDGNVYRVDTSGSISGVFPATTSCCLGDITAGPDGNLWFTDAGTNSIGQITTSGTVTEYTIPTENSSPNSIAPSPCGNTLWFTERNPDQNGTSHVGEITTSGVITEYPVPTQGSSPEGITPGPDGNIWFTENSASQIGRADDLFFHITCVSYIASHVFLPGTVKSGQGRPVGWLMQDPGTHGIVDSSGMGLFGSQDALPYGEVYQFAFVGAGTYAYDDPFNVTSTGRVKVPMIVALVPGTRDEAQVTWASAQPPPGFVFDVQVKQPNSSTWLPWMTGVSSLTAMFGPGDPLWIGAGTYSFRSRIHNTTNNAASGYSPAKSIYLSQDA